MAVLGALLLSKSARKFIAKRQQFTIRSLLILTFIVALLCSLAHYVGYEEMFQATFLVYITISMLLRMNRDKNTVL